VTSFFRDVKRSVRALVRRPQFAALAVLAMALGIGANTALFSIVDAVLLRPLPFRDSSRLVVVVFQNLWGSAQSMDFDHKSVAEIRSQSHEIMSGLGTYGLSPRSWTLRGRSTVITCGGVSRGFFEALGVRPALGRFFIPREFQRGRLNVAVLGHRLWVASYDASPKVLGQTMIINGEPYTIVGVAPPGLNVVWGYHGYIGAWLPSSLRTAPIDQYTMLARLRPGTRLPEVRALLATVSARLAALDPKYKGHSFSVYPLREFLTNDVRPAFLLLLGASFLVLLIAVVNVANLLLVRGRQRAKEVAVEIALGATRGRVVLQWMVESCLLALAGAAAGLLLALFGIGLFQHFATSTIQRMPAPHLSWQMIAFCVGVASVAGVAVGIFPAIQASRLDPNGVLRVGEASGRAGGSRELRRVMRGLMVAEVALAFSVAAGSLLLVRSFAKLTTVRTGMRVRHVLTLRIYVPTQVFRTHSQPDEWKPFVESLLARVRSVPGVESAGAANFPLLIGEWGFYTSVKLSRVVMPRVDLTTITPGYFQSLGIPLLEGREFSNEDAVEGAPPPGTTPNVHPNAAPAEETRASSAPMPVIVDRMFAHTAWGTRNPLGRVFSCCSRSNPLMLRVVGVVGNTRSASLAIAARPAAYAPLFQVPHDYLALAVHTSVAASSLVRPVEKEIWSVNSGLAITRVRTMSELIAENEAGSRFRTLLLSVFAFLGVALAVVGVYGVSSYAVTQRTHEFGLRMALGAQRGDVLRLVLAEGACVAAVGVAAGLAVMLALAGLLRGLLFGVTASDPATLAVAATLITGAALFASYLPARRAAQVDPAAALRWE
jgi:putative ABC transport system permease protein